MDAPAITTPVDVLVVLKTLGFSTWGVYSWLERARRERPVTKWVDRYDTAPADICRTLAIHIAKLPKTRPCDPRDAASVRAAYPADEVEQTIFRAYQRALATGTVPSPYRTGPFAHVYHPGRAQYGKSE